MDVRKTDEIFKDYNTGGKTLEETNEALKDMDAGFHLESLTDKERAEKNERENIAGTVDNPNWKGPLPKDVDMHRRLDLIGTPRAMREVVQHTKKGTFRVIYDDQGYAVRATRI